MASGAAALPRIFNYRLLLVLAAVVFLLDQVTKFWVAAALPFGTYQEPDAIGVIPGFFRIVHVGNTGAAWGLFAGKSLWLALLAIATLTAIFIFRHHLELKRPVVQVCFGLLCGGIVGNLVDRLLHQHVIDFLLFHIGDYAWPAFNVADSAICVGVGLYLWYSFKTPVEKPASRP